MIHLPRVCCALYDPIASCSLWVTLDSSGERADWPPRVRAVLGSRRVYIRIGALPPGLFPLSKPIDRGTYWYINPREVGVTLHRTTFTPVAPYFFAFTLVTAVYAYLVTSCDYLVTPYSCCRDASCFVYHCHGAPRCDGPRVCYSRVGRRPPGFDFFCCVTVLCHTDHLSSIRQVNTKSLCFVLMYLTRVSATNICAANTTSPAAFSRVAPSVTAIIDHSPTKADSARLSNVVLRFVSSLEMWSGFGTRSYVSGPHFADSGTLAVGSGRRFKLVRPPLFYSFL